MRSLTFSVSGACGLVDMPKEAERVKSGGDGFDGEAEVLDFEHHCAACAHVIAKHHYTFEVDEEFQKYEMDCPLCGYGQHEVSIEVEDPRLAPDPLLC